MKENLIWLKNKIKASNLDGMIISNPVNIKYLTGLTAEGTLLITPKENIFITDSRYIESVNSKLTLEDEIVVYNIKETFEEDYKHFFDYCENVGFEENYVTYADYKKIMIKYKINNLEETEFIIEKQRMIKEEEEIENIRKACKITDDCFEFLKTYIKVGQTEEEIAKKIVEYFNNNAEGVSFSPIVASGPNSAVPHAEPTKRQIREGDMITIDMGCKVNGYASDMTRTIFVSYVPEEIKEIYDLVLKNQKQVLLELRAGSNLKEISSKVEEDFEKNGYLLVHSLGHGVGLDIHELPFINSKKEEFAKANMVITNEPGIYIPGRYGVRIEDTCLILDNRCEVLTKSEKGYVIVDKENQNY